MAISRRLRNIPKPPDVAPIVHLWLLRMLSTLGGHRGFIGVHGFSEGGLPTLVGLGHWEEPCRNDFDVKTVRAELRKLCHDGERRFAKATVPPCLCSNVARLAKLVGLFFGAQKF